MTAARKSDLLVLGAGPAGASAAIAAAASGLDVVLLDESPKAGGQIWRAPLDESAPKGRDARDGARLRQALAASSATHLSGRRVWAVGRASGGFEAAAAGPEGAEVFTAPRLICCAGAIERITPFQGWTLPGVIGLAAATALQKGQGMTPGRRLVVAGAGPLLAAVAAKAAAGGADILAVVDAASPGEWLRVLPSLARRPALLAQGAGWALRLAGRRVPVFFRSGVREALGDERVECVVIGPLDAEGAPVDGPTRRFEVDCLAVGDGLTPSLESLRLLGAAQRYEHRLGGWVPSLDPDGRTDIPGLYAAGDGAGIRGGAPAVEAGALAGLAAAQDAGAIDNAEFAARAAPHRRRLARLKTFADAVGGLLAARPRRLAGVGPETVVCRCEDVTRGAIETALDEGAGDLDQLKHFTRCGMGPCQGRFCGETVAELAAARLGGREAAGYWTPRPPLRPMPLEDLIGDFTYDDIPIPAPAPL